MLSSIKKKLITVVAAGTLAVGALVCLPAAEAQAWAGGCGVYTYHSASNDHTCTWVRHVLGHDNTYSFGPKAARTQTSNASMCYANEWFWGYERD
ncbi:MAG: hypothetical protein LBK42_03870 [Propionibacteriaceae bacterium]|jgi:hypothetical protein|nr:hypothetical protein [Propionibacteriaceae bacterium]